MRNCLTCGYIVPAMNEDWRGIATFCNASADVTYELLHDADRATSCGRFWNAPVWPGHEVQLRYCANSFPD